MFSHFDEQAAELVGFQLCFPHWMAWRDSCNFIHLRSYVNF